MSHQRGFLRESHIVLVPLLTRNRKHQISFPDLLYLSLFSASVCSPYNAKNPYLAPIRVIRELHKGGERSCMHVEMDISGSRLNYVAGDHLAIFPSNDPQLVERIGELLDVDLNTVFSLTNIDGMSVLSDCTYMYIIVSLFSLSTETASKKHPFPCPTSYRTALLFYVDITSPPRTNVLRELAEFASDSNDRDFLLRITSPTEEGKVSVSV